MYITNLCNVLTKAFFILFQQGIVSGVLLVTPHSIMFQPNVSDPLVMDRGQDAYCIAAQMSAITSAAMYHDIAAMAIHDPLKPGRFVSCCGLTNHHHSYRCRFRGVAEVVIPLPPFLNPFFVSTREIFLWKILTVFGRALRFFFPAHSIQMFKFWPILCKISGIIF